jgi:formylglycine-generating enzyme required for sulfatase activity
MVLGLVAFIASCSKEKAPQIKAESASEKFEKDVTGEPTKEKAPQIKAESVSEKFETASNDRGITKEPTKKESSGKEEVIELGKDVKLEMVLIPAGKFKMGSPESEKGHSKAETQHEVTLTKPFYIGKYEVTQEQWESVMGKNPSASKGAKLPVTQVSWEDCQEFIKKLNAKTKGGYRLPTEAEWEYSCRAGTTTAYSFGDNLTKSDANINGESTKAVGSYKPNAFGLYDLHGNVWEWCEDWYGDYPEGAVTDSKGPGTGEYRVLRGVSFGSYYSARSSFRINFFAPTLRFNGTGFRLARTS